MAILTNEEQEKVVHAIGVAENLTSGEIRVVVENVVGDDKTAFEKATHFFEELDMHKTVLRNGVLIYLAIADHQFAIIGDDGIHKRVGDNFWESTKQVMIDYFRKADYVSGLVEGIKLAGEQLHHYFPRQEDDINELPNEIHFGNS